MDKKSGLYAFGFTALLVVAMAWATRDEHVRGSAHAYAAFYNSMWFTLLWIVAATFGCYFVAVRSLHKRLPVFMLHAAFLLILSGALTTRLTGKTGQVHLRDEQIASFFDEWTHRKVSLPFALSLKSFEIEYYPGTRSPANYISVVEVTDSKTDERFVRRISMNNILRYKGYRFYQSSFDEDWQGSVLSVNRDTWGIALSYAGYFLMFFSMLMILFDKRERFRFLIRKLGQKTALIAALSAATTLSAASQTERLGNVWIEYQGRISPIETLANDFTIKLTGKNRYQTHSAEQFFFGWLFFSEKWENEPMFQLKSDELKHIAGTKDGYARLSDFFDAGGRNKLEPYYRLMYASNKPDGWLKEAVKLNDKFHLIDMLQSGALLKIFPMKDENGKLRWFAPDMDIPAQTDTMENVFAKYFFALYYEALAQGDAATAGMYAGELLAFQQKKAGNTLPSPALLKAEHMYNRVHLFSWLFKICLTIGTLCLLFFMFADAKIASGKRFGAQRCFHIALWIVFAAATTGLALRTCIGGRLPVSNSYETMLLLAWLSLLTGILARRYSFLLVAFSFLMAGFTLLVAHISSMNPQITPLAPVLQSPLLSIHVLVIMVSYGLCGFMAFNSIAALATWLAGSRKRDKTEYIQRMKETSELFMYPAAFLMGAGIFIGAIWANQSWGRYWGWDPKEVWALVTFLLMAFTFHDRTLTWFRKPVFYHIFVLVIFLSVLMTYFGVNYLLGGRHSYAG